MTNYGAPTVFISILINKTQLKSLCSSKLSIILRIRRQQIGPVFTLITSLHHQKLENECVLQSTVAVSYTHLDVYKRQALTTVLWALTYTTSR